MVEMSNSEKDNRMHLILVYASWFFDCIGYSLVVPIMPYFQDILGGTERELGLVFTCYSLTQLFSCFMMGWGSDVWGRRPLLLISLLGSFFGFLAQGCVKNMPQMLMARAFAGFFGGSGVIAQAVIADCTTVDKRPRYIALLEATDAVSCVLGPAIGGLLGLVNIRLPFFVAGIVAGCAFVLAMILFEETRPEIRKINELRKKRKTVFKNDKELISAEIYSIKKAMQTSRCRSRPRFTWLMILCFVCEFSNQWALMAYDAIYGMFLKEKFGMLQWQFGVINVLQGFWTLFQQAIMYNVIIYKWKVPITLAASIGGIIQLVAYLTMGFGNPVLISVMGGFLMWTGSSLASPSTVSILSSTTHEDQQGFVLGVNMVIGQVSYVVSPSVLATQFSKQHELPYVFSTIFGGIVAVIMFILYRMPNGKNLGRGVASPELQELTPQVDKKTFHAVKMKLDDVQSNHSSYNPTVTSVRAENDVLTFTIEMS